LTFALLGPDAANRISGQYSKALKLGPITDDKPVKVTVELLAALRQNSAADAEGLAKEQGQPIACPVKPIAPMLDRFIATDRGFAKARRGRQCREPMPAPGQLKD
jgi:hypothetical protein